MNKKYIVRLNDEERQQLIELTSTGKAAAYKIRDYQDLSVSHVSGTFP